MRRLRKAYEFGQSHKEWVEMKSFCVCTSDRKSACVSRCSMLRTGKLGSRYDGVRRLRKAYESGQSHKEWVGMERFRVCTSDREIIEGIKKECCAQYNIKLGEVGLTKNGPTELIWHAQEPVKPGCKISKMRKKRKGLKKMEDYLQR
ncbi:hypothetical protein CEXT_512621 [Caerostris extrusa]|uniref:Uncharacterized protein n=1 Tax=Caerostris extrusa TaxID=172846 RepID=A0AAV4VAQ2_CAEEX|nr:hypothetical protein CEXT_512621 [Caerostris extrusa]